MKRYGILLEFEWKKMEETKEAKWQVDGTVHKTVDLMDAPRAREL